MAGSPAGFSKYPMQDWIRATFYSNYDKAQSSSLPGDKIAGFCTPLLNEPWPNARRVGLSHIMAGAGSPINKDEKFWTEVDDALFPRSTTGVRGWARPTDAEAYSIGQGWATGFSAKSFLSDQVNEGQNPLDIMDYWPVMSKVYDGYWNGVGSPAPENNNIMGSYIGGLQDIGLEKFKVQNGGYNNLPLHPYYVDGFKSQAQARKVINVNNQTYNNDHEFFNYGMQNKINLLTRAYAGFNEPDEKHVLFSFLAEGLRKKLAGIKRTAFFSSPWSQSVTLPIDLQYKNTGWFVPVGNNGDGWVMQEWPLTPFSALEFIGFYGLLLLDGWVLWDSYRFNHIKDPALLRRNTDLTNNNRFKWYSPSGNPAPAILNENDGDMFPWRPLCGQDMAIKGIKEFETIYPILSASQGVQHLQYVTGGTTVTPSVGVLGNFVPSATKLNYGQDTILHLADRQQGLCVGAVAGSKWFVSHFNPYLTPSQKESIKVVLPDGREYIFNELRGQKHHLFYA